jgi:hypothetical protein
MTGVRYCGGGKSSCVSSLCIYLGMSLCVYLRHWCTELVHTLFLSVGLLMSGTAPVLMVRYQF